jgi:hypothetical protein
VPYQLPGTGPHKQTLGSFSTNTAYFKVPGVLSQRRRLYSSVTAQVQSLSSLSGSSPDRLGISPLRSVTHMQTKTIQSGKRREGRTFLRRNYEDCYVINIIIDGRVVFKTAMHILIPKFLERFCYVD